MTSSADQPKYWAFISYSHADSKWGKWLHKQLETFPVPRALVGKKTERGYDVPKRLMPIFRDREELPGSATLKDNIQEALEQSRYLVVICSPRSAASIWVNEEVLTFKAMGRSDRVLCLIVDGEPNATDKPGCGLLECFPPAVRHAVNPDRSLSQQREEPIAADARPGKDGKVDALLKLASGLLGVGFDELKQRDARRRRRQKVGYAMAGAAFVALLAWGAWEFQAQRVRLQNAASSMADFREAAATFDSGDSGLGMAYLARALKKDPANKAAAQRLFYELTYKNWVQAAKTIASGEGAVDSAQLSPDLTKLALIQIDRIQKTPAELIVLDALAGKTLHRFRATPEWKPLLVSFCGNNILAVRASSPADIGFPNVVTTIDAKSGKILKELRLPGSAANCVLSTKDGKSILIGWGRTEPQSYHDAYSLTMYCPAAEEDDYDVSSMTLESGAIQMWRTCGGEPTVKIAAGPIVCLAINESDGFLYAGSIGRKQNRDVGYLQKLALNDLSASGNVVPMDSWPIDIGISGPENSLIVSGNDSKTRIYKVDASTGALVLRSTVASRDRSPQKILGLGEMFGLASMSGDARVASLDGNEFLPAWNHQTRAASMGSDYPLNLNIVSWSGISPTDRGGKIFTTSLLDPEDDARRRPLEPALWWPSKSIFLAALSQRADQLSILRHGPSPGGFGWDLLSIDLINRTARKERAEFKESRTSGKEAPAADDKTVVSGSFNRSPSGRYFACLRSSIGGTTGSEIVVFDAEARRLASKAVAPEGTTTVFFSSDENRIITISPNSVSILDLALQKTNVVPSSGVIYHSVDEHQPLWVTPNVASHTSDATLFGVVDTDKKTTKYHFVLCDASEGRVLARAPIPSRPTDLALAPDGSAVVVSWTEGEAEKCAVFDTRDGRVIKAFPDNQWPKEFSLDGRRLLMGGFPNDILYETLGWSQVADLSGHSRMVSAHAFDPLNRFIVTGSLDGTIRLWNLLDGAHVGEEMPPLAFRTSRPKKAVVSLEFDQDGERLLAGFQQLLPSGELITSRSAVSIWDVSQQLATLPDISTPYLAGAWFVKGGDSVAIATGDDGGSFVSYLDVRLPDQELPSRLWTLAEEVSGYRVADQITKSDELPNVAEAANHLRQSTSEVSPSLDNWLRWYTAHPHARTISPLSTLSTAEYRRILIEELGMQEHLLEAFEMVPSDDLNLANLALQTDQRSFSEGAWGVLLQYQKPNKDILFRRAVRLLEDSWDGNERGLGFSDPSLIRDAALKLASLVRNYLEGDLVWSPRHQGSARSMLEISRDGFLDIIIYSGTPKAAKRAALLSVGEIEHDTSKQALDNFIEQHYSHHAEKVLLAFNYNRAWAFGACALDTRKSFWLDQAGHPLGKRLTSYWVDLAPYFLVNTVLRDADNWLCGYPEMGLPLWEFIYKSMLDSSGKDSGEQGQESAEASGLLATNIAFRLITAGNQSADAEFYAREGLSQRQKAGVTGWPLASSKSLVGAALFQQNKLGEAEPFVAEGAKELLSLKDTVPEEARQRVVEAVDRAKSLYEKTGNQAQASYWSAELEKLQNDPRYALLE